MVRRVSVVTGSRAEYGLLKPLLLRIKDSDFLDLSLIVTGMHLAPVFGLTVDEIIADGFAISRKVESQLSSDTSVGTAKSIGLGIIGFADAFEELEPDLLVVLGDRYEVFAAASAAVTMGIPIAHIHGGEVTRGSVDDSYRHSITKMSSLHFTAHPQYRKRVIQLGEPAETVFDVGPLAQDSVASQDFLDVLEVANRLEVDISGPAVLVTFHPVTGQPGESKKQFQELLDALVSFPELQVVFTLPNADAEGFEIRNMIYDYVRKNPDSKSFENLGNRLYLSAVFHGIRLVGNSSSGVIEAPLLGQPSLNVGTRQDGRFFPPSVIDAPAERDEIVNGLSQLIESMVGVARITSSSAYPASPSQKIVDTLQAWNPELQRRGDFVDLQ